MLHIFKIMGLGLAKSIIRPAYLFLEISPDLTPDTYYFKKNESEEVDFNVT